MGRFSIPAAGTPRLLCVARPADGLPGGGEENRAVKAMAGCENSGKCRDGFFGTVLLVRGKQHDVLAVAGARAAVQFTGRLCEAGCRKDQKRNGGAENGG